MSYKIMEYDPYLAPYEGDINMRMANLKRTKERILGKKGKLLDFANGAAYFGFHREDGGWYYREWAPGAQEMYLTGDFCNWDPAAHKMERKDDGTFEIFLPGEDTLYEGCKVQAVVVHDGQWLRRIPAYATHVEQAPGTIQWNAVIKVPKKPFKWTDADFHPKREAPYIYETHVGMSSEEPKIASYTEFKETILPRVIRLGYNTIQIMAIMEHPYYASFGYQVTNFFAASSWFGQPDELKDMINTAHSMGIRVLLDIVHSHAAPNSAEGLNEFDGTDDQYFHPGDRGRHREWGTKCFNYGKTEVLHFLLSNLKFWMTEYHFDGFRFDGVTSMLYLDHALGHDFMDYSSYFSPNTDTDAVTYLQLANELIHKINPEALSICEDMSGMPGMCLPVRSGGIGFDYRLGMGTPPMWIKYLDKVSDENWDMWNIWTELSSRRPREKVIGYVESHDQALVGDKTVMFRLCDKEMYWYMNRESTSDIIDRGIALHKMIRLITESVAGEGYLTFMGNEFGHPEWIDFPRDGNGNSFHYCRRLWSIGNADYLKYLWLLDFDIAMVDLSKKYKVLEKKSRSLWIDQLGKVIAYERGGCVFVFNFNPTDSHEDYFVPMPSSGRYKVVLSTDEGRFGGYDRISTDYVYSTETDGEGKCGIRFYLPLRTAAVLRKQPAGRKKAGK